MRDLANSIDIKKALAGAIASNTTTAGEVINREDKLGESLTFGVQVVAFTDGSYEPLVEHSDDNVTYTAVSDEDLLGTEAGAALTAADEVAKIGYVGAKKYVRLSVVSTGVSTGATLGAQVITGHLLGNPDITQVQ